MPDDEQAVPIPKSDRLEAVRRIRECEETGQTWLDLGDLVLEQLPPELGQLTRLRHLALGTTALKVTRDDQVEWLDSDSRRGALTDLSPLVNLTALSTLSLVGCTLVSDLGPLRTLAELTRLDLSSCESVSDIGPLGSLTGLTFLNLTKCGSVSDLGPLRTLTRLTILSLQGCASISDLSPLRSLTELTALTLSFCDSLSDLGALGTLTRLSKLTLAQCELVSDVGPLRNLTELTLLILDGCKSVTDLSPLMDLSKLRYLDVRRTGVSLPDYYRDSFDAMAFQAWYRETMLATGKRPLAEVKLLIVGQGRVGKTQLRLRCFEGMGIAHHDPTLESTKHIDYTEATERTEFDQVKLRVWDFGGQNELHSSHRFFLGSQRCFYILVLAADRPANGESSDSNRLNYWLRVIAEYGRRDEGQRAPVVVVVTRSDVERAKSYHEELDDALETARKYDWFGANVVEVVRGLGWSRGLSETTHKAIWERHESAARALGMAIYRHLATVIDLEEDISVIYHWAKAFVEKAFSKEQIDGDNNLRTCIAGEDLKRFAKLFEQSEAQKTEEEREGLRRDCLGLLNSLGVVHWVGDMPEINLQNRWNLRDIAFNPEWVRRPVYDLIRCSDTDPDRAGFLPDQQVRVLLAERQCGNPDATDLYDQLPFRREDRARVLELMKACRLVFDMAFDDRAEGGLLVPDLLRATSLPDEDAPAGTWMVMADLLPEKMFLRFIARHYDAIDHHAARCFRNQVVWRTGSESVLLEAHYSPPGATLPHILIRSATPNQPIAETVAATLKALFQEIYRDERLGHVHIELTQVGKPTRLRATGRYVFRCEILELPATRNRPAKMVPKFTIVFNGVDLGSTWSSLVGLGHLHRLIRQPGKLIAVGDFSRAERSDAAKGYKFRQEGVKAGNASPSLRRPSPKFATYSTKKLKQLCKAAGLKLERAPNSETKETYARQVQELTEEIERRSNPELKTGMRSIQAELRKAVNELKARMKDKNIPEELWEHFDHCASSAGHEFQFKYEKPKDIAWDTD